MASPSVTQSGGFTDSGKSTGTLATTAITSASDCLWWSCTVQKGTGTTCTVSSIASSGVTWTKVTEYTFTLGTIPYTISVWKAPLGSRTTYSSTTLTWTLNTTCDGISMVFWATTGDNVAGGCTLDPNVSLPLEVGNASGSPTGTYSTTNADDLLLSFVATDSGSASSAPNGFSGFNSAHIWPANQTYHYAAYKSVSATQSCVSLAYGANIEMLQVLFAESADAASTGLNTPTSGQMGSPLVGIGR